MDEECGFQQPSSMPRHPLTAALRQSMNARNAPPAVSGCRLYPALWTFLLYYFTQSCLHTAAGCNTGSSVVMHIHSWVGTVHMWIAGLLLRLRWWLRPPTSTAADMLLQDQPSPALESDQGHVWTAAGEAAPHSNLLLPPADLPAELFGCPQDSISALPSSGSAKQELAGLPAKVAVAAAMPQLLFHQPKQPWAGDAAWAQGGQISVKALVLKFEQKPAESQASAAALCANPNRLPSCGSLMQDVIASTAASNTSGAVVCSPATASCTGGSLPAEQRRQRHAHFAEGPPEEHLITARYPRIASTVSELQQKVSTSMEEAPEGLSPHTGVPLQEGHPALGGSAASLAQRALPLKPVLRCCASEQSGLSGSVVDLADVDALSDCSGASGASSASRLSRLSALARRRSKRKDVPLLEGVALGLLKVKVVGTCPPLQPGHWAEDNAAAGLPFQLKPHLPTCSLPRYQPPDAPRANLCSSCGQVDNPLRSRLYALATLRAFDYFILTCVMLSCVGMALETASMDPASHRAHVLHAIDLATTAVFWVRIVLESCNRSGKLGLWARISAVCWQAGLGAFTRLLSLHRWSAPSRFLHLVGDPTGGFSPTSKHLRALAAA